MRLSLEQYSEKEKKAIELIREVSFSGTNHPEKYVNVHLNITGTDVEGDQKHIIHVGRWEVDSDDGHTYNYGEAAVVVNRQELEFIFKKYGDLNSHLITLLSQNMDYEEACRTVAALSPEELDQHLEWAASKLENKS